MYPLVAALASILLNTSTTRLKRRGDKGSPYLNHLPGLKKLLFSSFNLIDIGPLLTKLIIQPTHF
jgi:ABC-type uncharacterized transport system permease subunit